MHTRLLFSSRHDVGPLFESEVGRQFDRTLADSFAQLLGGATLNTNHIPANPLPITQN